MPYGSGLGASVGWAAESTYGTYVAPAKWGEFNNEKLTLSKKIIANEGLRGGARFGRVNRRVVTTREAKGSLEFDVSSKGFGVLLTHMLGTTTPTATLVAGTGSLYRQIHTPGEMSRSLTIQVGRPQTDAVVKPFTYTGCKFPSFELSCSVDEYLSLKLDVDARNETTAQTLVAPTYTTGDEMFHFGQLDAEIGGTVTTTTGLASVSGGVDVTACKGFTVKQSVPLATDRYFAGASSLKASQIENGMREVTGSLKCEFASQAQLYDLMNAETTTALRFRFNGTTAVGTGVGAFEVLLSACRFNEATPTVGGPDILENEVSFTAYDDGVNAPIQIVYESADATVL